ncbi:hypothetical protein K1719_032643 [Acacia pycnantha]|nr:hypothetical protein K1719_032643 [Acacia pycnantha]
MEGNNQVGSSSSSLLSSLVLRIHPLLRLLGFSNGSIKGNEDENRSTSNKDMSSIYQEQRVQPCRLSSSIYYGGQDVYSHPQKIENAGLNSLCKKDGRGDDSGSASRGHWWHFVL